MIWMLIWILTVTSSSESVSVARQDNKPFRAHHSEYQLLKDLFRQHDALAWPFPGRTTAEVELRYVFNALLEFDEKRQVLRTSGMFFTNWHDETLTWDPQLYNDTKVIYVYPSMVWKPEMVVINSVKAFGVVGTDSMKMYVEHTGQVMWFPGDVFETFCKVDITYYPLDVQTCSIDLKIWGCPLKGANIVLSDTPVQNVAEKNGEWEILSITGDNSGDKGPIGVSFVIRLKRRTMFYVINMMLPVVFLSLLNFLVFGLPAESGEKMTLSVSVLISYAVFLTLVNDKLPENSEGLCCFSAYLAAEVFLSVAACLGTVIVLHLHHKPRAAPVNNRFLLWLVKPAGDSRPDYYDNHQNVWSTDTMELMDAHDKKLDGKQQATHYNYVSWNHVARRIDKICFRLFWILNTVVTVIFLLGISGNLF